ncbi:MAG: hypothetical protein ACRCYU_21195, partial [Nocardioides sp.]
MGIETNQTDTYWSEHFESALSDTTIRCDVGLAIARGRTARRRRKSQLLIGGTAVALVLGAGGG